MSKLTFSFTKKLEKPTIKPTQSQFELKDKDEHEEKTVLITSICNNRIETEEKPVEKQELVIKVKPNQNKLKYKRIKRENQTGEDSSDEFKESANDEIKSQNKSGIKNEINDISERPKIKEERLVDQQAVESMDLNEQAKFELLDEAFGKRPVKKENDLTIRLSKAELPDEPVKEEVEEADYSKVSVEEFGMALLRGMAKNPDDLKQDTIYEPKACPGGMGLGFERRLKVDKAKKKSKRYLPGQDDEEEENKKDPDEIVDDEEKIGSLVCVEHGESKGHYGRIVSISDDLSQCQVQLSLSKQIVSLAISLVRCVSKREFNKESKVLNRTKYDQFKHKSEVAARLKEERGGEQVGERRNRDERHCDERHRKHHEERHREERNREERNREERNREERNREEKHRNERSRTEREDDRRRRERSSKNEYSSRMDDHSKRDRSYRDERQRDERHRDERHRDERDRRR